MTWAYFDDGAPKHPKAIRAGNEAWGLWAAAVMYCNRWLTDGVVTIEALTNDCLPVPIPKARAKKLAEKLCEAKQRPDGVGLLTLNEDGTYQVHDFLDWNKSKAEVEAKRAADRARKKGGASGGSGGTGGGDAPPPNPPGGGADSERNPKRNPKRNPDGVAAESALPARGPARTRAGGPPFPPSPPSPARPSDQGSNQERQPEDLTGQGAEQRSATGGLAGRLESQGADPEGKPKPRHDPLFERVAFGAWFPSREILAWTKAQGLDDRAFDEALADARNKLRGPGDFGWWDSKILKFLDVAIARRRGQSDAAPDPDAEARQARADAAHRAHVESRRREAEAELAAARARGEDPEAAARALLGGLDS